MNHQTKQPAGSPSGAASLIAAAVILAITAFAAMCLATASADARILTRELNADAAWYAADAEANMIIAQIRTGNIPENVSYDNNHYAFTVSIDNDRDIAVELEIKPDQTYTILRYQTVRSNAWDPDESIAVWTGE